MTTDTDKKATVKVVGDNALPEGCVSVRILKFGDGQVHTGESGPDSHPLTFKWKDTAILPRPTALALEARGFVEIDE